MMWGAGRGGGEGGGSRRGRGPLQDGLPFRVGSLENSVVPTLRCPAHLRLGCGIDTQDWEEAELWGPGPTTFKPWPSLRGEGVTSFCGASCLGREQPLCSC